MEEETNALDQSRHGDCRLTQVMSLFDLFIIYFAAGAPFGVYRATTLKGAVTVNVVLGLLLQIVLWPVFTVRMLVGGKGDQPSSGKEIGRLQAEIEQIAFAKGSGAAIFDFREVFSRYTGLSRAVAAEVRNDQISEIFEVSKADDPILASVCLERRNREKLIFHHIEARNEFVDIIGGMAIDSPEVISRAAQIAVALRDEPAVEDLAALTAHSDHRISQNDGRVKVAA